MQRSSRNLTIICPLPINHWLPSADTYRMMKYTGYISDTVLERVLMILSKNKLMVLKTDSAFRRYSHFTSFGCHEIPSPPSILFRKIFWYTTLLSLGRSCCQSISPLQIEYDIISFEKFKLLPKNLTHVLHVLASTGVIPFNSACHQDSTRVMVIHELSCISSADIFSVPMTFHIPLNMVNSKEALASKSTS